MRTDLRTICVLFAASLCVGGLVAASESGPTAPDRDLTSAEPAHSCVHRTANDLLKEFQESRSKVDGIPDCPAEKLFCPGGTNKCVGTVPCWPGGGSSTVDTGERKCRRADGGLLVCHPGETVHITTRACTQCPCCTGPPPNCFCPNDCGETVRLSCQ